MKSPLASCFLPLGVCSAVVAFVWSVQHDPFFWDTVQLASKHAHHFYQNGLAWSPLPEEIDSGHPPLLGWYLAAVWSVFGKNLPASHWAMLPFLLANVWLLHRLGLRLGGPRWAWWLPPLALLDPVLAGQSALVSPDVMLTTWFLLAVEGILGKNRWFVTVAVVGLCTVSMRGMMTAAALAVWSLGLESLKFESLKFGVRGLKSQVLAQLQTSNFKLQPFKLRTLKTFLPGFLLAAAFLCWHWQTTGWVGYHTGSPWAGAFVRAEGLGLLKNAAVLGWRWADFGRWAEWVVLLWAIASRRVDKRLLALLVLLALFLAPSALLYANLSAHRYFLPLFLGLHLVAFHGVVSFATRHSSFSPAEGVGGHSQPSNVRRPPSNVQRPPSAVRRSLLGLLIVSLATGNLWVYPRGVSMDWDSTLAHLPYHAIRHEAVVFLEKKGVDFQTVGSAFPNLNTGENLLLNGDERQFAPLDFEQNRFVLASNVFNDINEPDYRRLERDWILLKKWQHPVGVWMVLYERRQ